jgi:hypothetical protein
MSINRDPVLSITGNTKHIKQSYNNKLESHSLKNYKRL